MENKNLSKIHEKQPGKCPMSIMVDKTEDGNKLIVAVNSSDKEPSMDQYYGIMQKLTGTQDRELAQDICRKGINAMPGPKDDEHNINTVYQALADMEPKDAIEAKLCLQAHVLYAQGMRCLRKAEDAEMMCHSEFYMRSAVKLLRLHNETVETLSRYRRKGEQKLIVQHVNVECGGQAVVGNMIV